MEEVSSKQRKQFSARIYTDRILKTGLADDLDIVDLVIIHYIFMAWTKSLEEEDTGIARVMDADDKGRVWIHYKTLLRWLPYLRINKTDSIKKELQS